MSTLFTIGAFLLALGPLIIIHELGHYWVARRCGVKVVRFSIGFGKPLLKFVRGADRTEWVLAAIPLGGYVAMLDEREGDMSRYAEADLKRAFNRQSVWKRIAIVSAGPVANLILAVVIYWAMGLYGVEEPRAILGAPAAGTIADHSGIREGDEIRTLNDEPVRSLVDLRWRILKIGVDHGVARMGLRDAAGHAGTAEIDFSNLATSDLEQDFLSRVGIVPAPPPPVIAAVTSGSVAERAGLRIGDRILAINDKPLDNASQLTGTIHDSAGKTLDLNIDREGSLIALQVTPEARTDPSRAGGSIGMIGIGIGGQFPMVTVRYGPIESVQRAVAQTWDLCAFSLHMIGKMLTGQVSLKNLSGPVTIADAAGQSARLGATYFISLVAFLSISIGLMNLMPIPLLDGGHLLYYFVEIIKGRPPSERFLEWSQRAGMLVLAGLMSVALFNDFSRLLS